MDNLRPFQRRFIKAATAPGIDTACLCLPRATGSRGWPPPYPRASLRAFDRAPVLCAASIEQARLQVRQGDLEARGGYRFLDSFTRCRLRTFPPTPAWGNWIERFKTCVRHCMGEQAGDRLEPGAWEVARPNPALPGAVIAFLDSDGRGPGSTESADLHGTLPRQCTGTARHDLRVGLDATTAGPASKRNWRVSLEVGSDEPGAWDGAIRVVTLLHGRSGRS